MLHSGETCLAELGATTNRQQNGWLRLVQMCHWQQGQLEKYQVHLQERWLTCCLLTTSFAQLCLSPSVGVRPDGPDSNDLDVHAAEAGAPATFFCPISFKCFRDPVLLPTGQTYVVPTSSLSSTHAAMPCVSLYLPSINIRQRSVGWHTLSVGCICTCCAQRMHGPCKSMQVRLQAHLQNRILYK